MKESMSGGGGEPVSFPHILCVLRRNDDLPVRQLCHPVYFVDTP